MQTGKSSPPELVGNTNTITGSNACSVEASVIGEAVEDGISESQQLLVVEVSGGGIEVVPVVGVVVNPSEVSAVAEVGQEGVTPGMANGSSSLDEDGVPVGVGAVPPKIRRCASSSITGNMVAAFSNAYLFFFFIIY